MLFTYLYSLLLGLSLLEEPCSDWVFQPYSSIPNHQFECSPSGLKIKVNQSASIIIIPFDQPLEIKKIQVEGEVKGSMEFIKGQKHGDEGVDDFPLRIGLIEKGERRLNFVQRIFAPNWLLQLEKIWPGQGIRCIHFVNFVYPEFIPNWKIRTHPSSEIFKERIAGVVQKGGQIKGLIEIPKSIESLGVWISTDGDDTKSKFILTLKKLAVY